MHSSVLMQELLLNLWMVCWSYSQPAGRPRPKPGVCSPFGLAPSRKPPAIDFYWRRPSPLFGHGEMTTLLWVNECWPPEKWVISQDSWILTSAPQLPAKRGQEWIVPFLRLTCPILPHQCSIVNKVKLRINLLKLAQLLCFYRCDSIS